MPTNRAREWSEVILAGLVAGAFINLCEWAARHWWLDAAWRDAFAALGRTPKGWAAFIPANFWLGILAVAGYRWVEQHYGRGLRTDIGTGIAIWIIFWVIPTTAFSPMELFPLRLLLATVAIGFLDGLGGVLLGAWTYRKLAARTS